MATDDSVERSVLRRMVQGELTPAQAAAELLRAGAENLAIGPGVFTADERRRLVALLPVLAWERTRLTTPEFRDIAYQSPEYHALWANGARIDNTPDPGSPG